MERSIVCPRAIESEMIATTCETRMQLTHSRSSDSSDVCGDLSALFMFQNVFTVSSFHGDFGTPKQCKMNHLIF